MGCCSSAKAKGDATITAPGTLEKPKEVEKVEKKEENPVETNAEQKPAAELNTEQQVVETIQADVDDEEGAVSKGKKKKKSKKKKKAGGIRESQDVMVSNEFVLGSGDMGAPKEKVEAIPELAEDK